MSHALAWQATARSKTHAVLCLPLLAVPTATTAATAAAAAAAPSARAGLGQEEGDENDADDAYPGQAEAHVAPADESAEEAADHCPTRMA